MAQGSRSYRKLIIIKGFRFRIETETFTFKKNIMKKSVLDKCVSMFENCTDPVPCGKVSLKDWLESGLLFKEEVEKYRECKNQILKKKRKMFRLLAITPSGTFS